MFYGHDDTQINNTSNPYDTEERRPGHLDEPQRQISSKDLVT